MTEDFTRGREQLAGEDWGRIGTIVNEGDYLINQLPLTPDERNKPEVIAHFEDMKLEEVMKGMQKHTQQNSNR